MNLICRLPIGSRMIGVYECPGLVESAGNVSEWTGQSIVIDPSVAGPERWIYLLHELIHAISSIYELEVDSEPVTCLFSELIYQAIGPYLHEPPAGSEFDEQTAEIDATTNADLLGLLGCRSDSKP